MAGNRSTKQAAIPTMMDNDTLRRVIGDMFKELRDNAITGVEDQVRYLRWTTKTNPTSEDSFQFPQSATVLDCDVNGGLPDDQWDDSVLELLYRGLADNRVEVQALGEGRKSIKDGSMTPSNKKPRVHDRLRDRLLRTIEKATGRALVPRSTKAFDPRHSDLHPPNSYEWVFSEQYPHFPGTKGGISRWPAEYMRQCHEALDNGWLVVVDVAQNQARPDQSATNHNPPSVNDNRDVNRNERNEPSESDEELQDPEYPSSESDEEQEDLLNAPNNTAESSNVGNHSDANIHLLYPRNTFRRELEELNVGAMNSSQLNHFVVEFHRRMIEDTLHVALKKQAHELKGKFQTRYGSQKQHLRAAVEDLSGQLDRKTQEVEAIQRKVAELEAEKQSLAMQLEDKDREVKTMVNKARDEGEAEGRRKTIDDFNTSMEGDISALRKSHLAQLSKVRADYYKEGFDAGRKVAPQTTSSESPTSSNQTKQVSIDFEALKKSHEEQRASALEHGRREGREMAYQELALSPTDRVNILISNNDALNKNRKIRELKTIRQNWKDVPQCVLPSYMLPKGHTPGDKTLYLLAKLSKELDKDKAGELLAEEISRRCEGQQLEPNSRIVTNADINNVLDGLGRSQGRSTTAASEDFQQGDVSEPIGKDLGSKPVSTSQKIRENRLHDQTTSIQMPKADFSPTSMSPKRSAVSNIMQIHFTNALQSWLDLGHDSGGLLASSSSKEAIVTEPQHQELRDTVVGRSKSAGMIGKKYTTTAEIKKLKHYLAGLTLELSSSFPLPVVLDPEDVVEVFIAIYTVFSNGNSGVVTQHVENKSHRQKSVLRERTQTEEVEEQSSDEQTPILKRKRTEDKAMPEQPKRQKAKSRQPLPQRVAELRRQQAQRSESEETIGSTIHIDPQSSNVKNDEDSEEEDLYGATPPPKAKRRPRRSAPV